MNDSKLPILPLLTHQPLDQIKRKPHIQLPEGLELLLKVLENNCQKDMCSTRSVKKTTVPSTTQVISII